MRQLRAGVVGVGYFGRIHARKYASLPGVRLIAVVDNDRARAASSATETGAQPYTDLYDALGRIDVASVAVPTSEHYRVGRILLEAGVHVLMEKPITADAEQAAALIELARAQGCILQVGHLERFLPVIRALLAQAGEPLLIEAHRLTPFKRRGTDVSVVLDLMIHDIDLVLTLVDMPLEQVDASGTAVLSEQADLATARLRFANGCVANLTASRISPKEERRLRLFQADACLTADMSRHTLDCYQQTQMHWPPAGATTGERKVLAASDPLRDEIRAFLASVRTGRPPQIGGADGLRALQTALAIIEQVHAHPLPGLPHADSVPRRTQP